VTARVDPDWFVDLRRNAVRRYLASLLAELEPSSDDLEAALISEPAPRATVEPVTSGQSWHEDCDDLRAQFEAERNRLVADLLVGLPEKSA
jgi:hypothetical protein